MSKEQKECFPSNELLLKLYGGGAMIALVLGLCSTSADGDRPFYCSLSFVMAIIGFGLSVGRDKRLS